MRLANVIFILTSFYSLFLKQSYAQQPSITLYSLTESNGLSDNRVTSLFQDRKGFMWIGTEDGLNRYDGSVFKTFKRAKEDSTELADNFIHSIAEDSAHHLWIATQNGLSEYNPVKNSFHSWRCNFLVNDINVMHDIWPDNKGNIWIATLGGLLQFIPDQTKFITHLISSDRSSDNRIFDIHVDKENRFWLATNNGLWRFYPDQGKFDRVKFEGNTFERPDLVNTVLEGHDGKLWLGYWSSGLMWYNPDLGESKKIPQPKEVSNIEGIAEVRDHQGRFDVWYADLIKIDDHEKITRHSIRINPPSSNYHITKLYTSRDGLLWICTDKGVMIMDPIKQFFHHHYFSRKISSQGIGFQQSQSTIYIGGLGDNFLKLYDSSFHQTNSYKLHSSLFLKDPPALLSIVPEDANRIWLTTENGLVLLNERTNEQQLFGISNNECTVATRNFFANLFIDSHKDHWIFPWRAGIWKFNLSDKKFTQQIEGLIKEGNKTKGFLIAAAAEDSQSNIWFADLDEGLIRYDRTTHRFSKPTEKIISPRYNLSNVIYDRPYIWAVTNGIVFKIHEQTLAVEQWPIPEELSKPITGFCADQQNHIWITTRSGLLSFDKASHQFKHFTVNDGLIDNKLTGTIFCMKNGKILYGDNNYITVFNPKELIKATATPAVLITQILSQNQPLQLHVNDGKKKYIELDYTFNNFIFDWAVLHYSNPLQNQYYCKLENVDKDWKYIGNTGRVQYASLLPGRYVFKARGATSDGIMNELGDEVLIIIHPPYWKSWWFFFGCGFGFLALTYVWYRYRLNEALKTERLRNKISADLHDEIGSTLSSISIMSDRLVQKAKEEKTVDVAHEIRENALVLMERMDDIVWSINPKNDSLENLLLRVKRFAAQLFEAKNIEYEIKIDQDVKNMKLSMEYRQNIYLILKEAINNMAKHSQCTKAFISVNHKQSTLLLLINDNGIGFDVNEVQFGNGIFSMKDRASAMKMQLVIDSQKGHGTTIQLTVKIK